MGEENSQKLHCKEKESQTFPLTEKGKRNRGITRKLSSIEQQIQQSTKPNQKSVKTDEEYQSAHLLFEHTEQLEVVKLVILEVRSCIQVQFPSIDSTLFRQKQADYPSIVIFNAPLSMLPSKV